jgi:HD superfamily phosphohydrolase
MADRVELPLDGFGDPKGPDKRIALSEDAISPRADDVTSPSFLQRELPPPKLYQDEVYGSKELTPLAIAVIATPEFQRLGHVYQLGTTHNVFRGANHRRFDHSVGTYFMSRTIMRRVVQNHARFHRGDPQFPHPGTWLSPRLYFPAPGARPEDQKRYSANGRWRGLTELVSVAALLHDIGHVPVGHTFEDEFSILEKHDGLGGSRMFELFFGPRTGEPVPEAESTVERFLGCIDESRLARPDPNAQRVPLPWLFEENIYDRFCPDVVAEDGQQHLPALLNWEVRELIFLLLSFKEDVTPEEHVTFDDLLQRAQEKAATKEDQLQRVRFISDLYERLGAPLDLGQDHERHPLFHPFMSDIVGNTICADLLDYLVRDGNRLHLDIRNNPRLQRYLVIRESHTDGAADDGRSRRRLTIYAVKRHGLPRRDTVSDLLDLMRERYRFAEVVYYHPKKCAFSSMFAKAMELSNPRPRDGGGVYPAPWAPPYLSGNIAPHVVHLGDEEMLTAFETAAATDHPQTNVRELVRRIRYRDEYPLLFTLDFDATSSCGGPEVVIRRLRDNNDQGRVELETMFSEATVRAGASEFAIDTASGTLPAVLVYCPHQRMQAKEVAASVELESGRVLPLNRQLNDEPSLAKEIDLLNTSYRRLWRLYLFVHPNLLARGPDNGLLYSMALGGLVDAFCDRFHIPSDARKRGCHFRYEPLRQRLEPSFDRFLGRIKNAPRDRILQLVTGEETHRDFWRNALQQTEPNYPMTENECMTGFAFASVVCAAGEAPERAREEWPAPLRRHDAALLILPGSTDGAEIVRAAAIERIRPVSANLLSANVQRQRPLDWSALVNNAGRSVKAK